jgi:proteasome accessory factor B
MKERVQFSRPPLARMLNIHGKLKGQAQVNCSSLAKEIQVCPKTIMRDIEFMRDQLELPIEFDPRLQTYRYTRPVTAFPTIQVSEGELLALLVAQKALEQYQGTPFHGQLKASFDKLASGLQDRISFSPADELRAVSFKSIGLGKTDLAIFNTLSTAVLKQKEVSFDYRKPAETEATQRRVCPYHLAYRNNLCYLVAYDLGQQDMRTFALPRISRVELSTKSFVRPENFSAEKFFAGALGVLGGEGDYHVAIRFKGTVATRVREREWHESQEMKELPDGGLELRLHLGALAEIENWVLGWGDSAEVIEPAELRDRIRKTISAMAENYRSE